jgi:hypothetical protein
VTVATAFRAGLPVDARLELATDPSTEPIARPLANLVGVIPVGALGLRVAERFAKFLTEVDPGGLMPVHVHRCDGGDDHAGAIRDALLDSSRIAGIEECFQLRGEGAPLELFVVIPFDPAEESVAARARQLVAETDVSALGITVQHVAMPIFDRYLETLSSEMTAGDTRWAMFIPFAMRDRFLGNSTEEATVTRAAKALTLLCTTGAGLLRRGRSGDGRTTTLGVGAAWSEDDESLLGRLAEVAAHKLIASQYTLPEGEVPSRQELPGELLRKTNLEAMVRRLIARTPYRLETDTLPWEVSLPSASVTVDVQGIAVEDWPKYLRRHRRFYDFARAKRWREFVERARDELFYELEDAAEQDRNDCYASPGGPRRVLDWADAIEQVLDAPLDLAPTTREDFDAALAMLEEQIAQRPDPLAVVARAALLGLFAAGSVSTLASTVYGPAIAGAAAVGVVAAAGIATAYALRRVNRALDESLRVAVRSLAGSYEAVMRRNLVRVVAGLQSRAAQLVASSKNEARRLVLAARNLDAPVARTIAGKASGALPLEPLIPAGWESAFFAELNPDWTALASEAAQAGALSPIGTRQAEQDELPLDRARTFIRSWLADSTTAESFEHQLAFRERREAGHTQRLLAHLDRAAALPGEARPFSVVWAAPPALHGVLPRSGHEVAEFRATFAARIECMKVGTVDEGWLSGAEQ